MMKMQAESFNLNQVRLLDGLFKDAMEQDRKYLHALDPDRLLHNFRITAGLPSTVQPLGGWEAPQCELRGHFTGHYLSACALMYASTGDEKLKKKADYMVAELARSQDALPGQGYNEGFLSAYPESFFDRVDRCEKVWAPYYTLHKILAGLLDVHQHCGNQQALDMLRKIAGWLKVRIGRLSREQQQKALGCEHGGMNEVLAHLYGVTGNSDHLELARTFDHELIFEPLARGEDRLDGLHANTQIPKVVGAAREYELTGEERYRQVASFFWRRVALKRSYVIGGHSDAEHFFPINQFSQHLSALTCETCNTYNMLKLTRHLFEWELSAVLMDFYERALYNHILASQDPQSGMMSYFASLKPGHFKSYSSPDNSFWCCTGTGIENHAKYGEAIYSYDDDSLYVNLFIASELNWREKGLIVRQETLFPDRGATQLLMRCDGPVRLALRIRSPAWTQSGMTLAVNDKPERVQCAPNSYAVIEREWKDGDLVQIHLPMTLYCEALPDNPHTLAFLFGPIVLAGELGTEGLEAISLYDQGFDLTKVPTPSVPIFVCEVKELLNHIEPRDAKPLTFQTKGIGKPRDVSLIPYFRLDRQRYSVYWQAYSAEAWKQKEAEYANVEVQRKANEARLVDEVRIAEQQSETDHNLQGESTDWGVYPIGRWRLATNGGWFSYDMSVLPDMQQVLAIKYWGAETGEREFDILINGTKIATQQLDNNKPGEMFTREYPIPSELIQSTQRVTVCFKAHVGKTAGALYGCAIMKAGR